MSAWSFATWLTIGLYLDAVLILSIVQPIPTPKRWPLALTVATYTVAPIAAVPALLVALVIRLAMPTANDNADDGRAWI